MLKIEKPFSAELLSARKVPSANVEANKKFIEDFKSKKEENAKELEEIREYFRDKFDEDGKLIDSKEINVVDFAGGEVFLADGDKPIAEHKFIRRTAKFKFFKKLGIITPVFGVLKALKECQGWTNDEMKDALENPMRYAVKVKLDEDSQIYAYVKSQTKSQEPANEFEALWK